MAITQVSNSLVKQDLTISGGTVDNTVIGSGTPAAGTFTTVAGTLASTVTGTTAAASDNSTKIATTAYVTTAIANLVDTAPSALNTLNELAAALGDDANFATTVNSSIAAKLPLAGGTMTGALNLGSQLITNVGASITFSTSVDGVINFPSTGYINFDSDNNSAGEAFVIGSNRASGSGGNEHFRVDASGNVGIGTSSITSGFKLEVTGDARFGDAVGDDAVELGWSSGGSQGFIQAYDRGASAFRDLSINNAVTVTSGGRVGIGISLPASSAGFEPKLAIHGSGSPGVILKDTDTAQENVVGTNGAGLFIDSAGHATATNNQIIFRTASSNSSFTMGTAMTIDSSQNVGIGTDSPTFNTGSGLEIQRAGPATLRIEDTGSGGKPFEIYVDDAEGYVLNGRGSGMPMYFKTVNQLAMTIDTNQNVGIGTSSPQSKLHSYTSGTGSIPTGQFNQTADDNTTLTLINANNSATYSAIKLETRESQAAGWMIANEFQSAFNGDLVFRGRDGGTSSAEVLRLKSNGNVGLGTSGPEYLLTLEDTTPTIALNHDTSWPAANAELGRIYFATDWNGVGAKIKGESDAQWGNTDYPGRLTFWTTPDGAADAVERMRISSSGNVLVGKSATTQTTAGTVLYNNGQIYATAAGSQPLVLTRTSSDGPMAIFYKDSGEVGRIGAFASRLYIGNSNTSLTFEGAADKIYPATSTGAGRDNAIDLGGSSTRFKDLYLSGGVVFGSASGSVTDATLDTYEEGNFSPTITGEISGFSTSGQDTTGKYVRIGNWVHLEMDGYITTPTGGSGTLRLTGLPFSMPAGRSAVGSMSTGRWDNSVSGDGWAPFISAGTNYLQFRAGEAYSGSGDGIETASTATISGNTTPFWTISISFRVS